MVRAGARATPWVPPTWLNRIARHPAIRLAFILQQADADMQEVMNNPGNQATLELLNHPAAQQIIADNHLLYGQQTGLAGLASLFTPGKYGIKFEADELLPGLSDTLSIAVGYPVDASTLTPDEALTILQGYEARLADEAGPRVASQVTADNVRVTRSRAEEIDCFEVPAGVDRAEFERQLKEQQDEINNTDTETLQRRRAEFINGNARRDTAAQRRARRQWIDDKTIEIALDEGILTEAAQAHAKAEASLPDATHILDMVAGGDPRNISGLADRTINRSIGAQWRGRRVNQLDAQLEEQRRQGRQKPTIYLEVC